ncbi:MAG: galactose mutarotase [Lachnoclostridium sp.]|nr:galactose mutarotase [Lachnoclostridium sp.]
MNPNTDNPMKNMTFMALVAGAILLMSSCSHSGGEPQLTKSGLNPEKFIAERDGKTTALYTLTNENGMEVCITNFGGRIVSIMTPDRDGKLQDVVLGFDSVAAYFPENNQSDFGAAIGRYANRINQGIIILDGDTIRLPQNNFGHCLHGGPAGWQYKVYDVKEATDSTLTLVMNSPDGDNNFPGNVTATVTYKLTADNSIDIDYSATTDKKTVINLTNHSYFNLNGDPTKPITDNILYIYADSYTPVDSTFMTTGEIAAVAGTPMDFTTPHAIGDSIDHYEFVQLKNGNGYDHNWVLNTNGNPAEIAAKLVSPSTGISLEVLTDEPGIQIYSGNFLDGTTTGKNGIVYNKRAAICLETQHYPDSPNKPLWPSVVLEPGQTYTSHCTFRFGVEK